VEKTTNQATAPQKSNPPQNIAIAANNKALAAHWIPSTTSIAVTLVADLQ
jgi:hypothetical protein